MTGRVELELTEANQEARKEPQVCPAPPSRWPGLSERYANRGSEAGAELVEFAVVTAGLSLLLMGIMGFSQALYAYQFISHAAREGARFAIVRGSACTTFSTACPASGTDVQNYVVSLSAGGIDTSSTNFTVTTSWPGSGAAADPCAVNSNNPGCPVRVVIQYNFHFNFPLLPTASMMMTSTSQMVISQ